MHNLRFFEGRDRGPRVCPHCCEILGKNSRVHSIEAACEPKPIITRITESLSGGRYRDWGCVHWWQELQKYKNLY